MGPILNNLRDTLDPWLGTPKWKQTHGRVTFYYRYDSEGTPVQKMRLKIEINTREHFHVLPLKEMLFRVENRWFQGQANVGTYQLEELLGTKLRALYQRKKGRDLFDLMVLLKAFPHLQKEDIIKSFCFYTGKENRFVSKRTFEKNLAEKLEDPLFGQDIAPLLHPQTQYDQKEAYPFVSTHLLSLLPETKGG